VFALSGVGGLKLGSLPNLPSNSLSDTPLSVFQVSPVVTDPSALFDYSSTGSNDFLFAGKLILADIFCIVRNIVFKKYLDN